MKLSRPVKGRPKITYYELNYSGIHNPCPDPFLA